MNNFILPSIRSIDSHLPIATTQTGNQFTQTGDDCDRDNDPGARDALDGILMQPTRDFRTAVANDQLDSNYTLQAVVTGEFEASLQQSGDGYQGTVTYEISHNNIQASGSFGAYTITDSRLSSGTRRLRDDCVEVKGLDGGVQVLVSGGGKRLQRDDVGTDAIVQYQNLYVYNARISRLELVHHPTLNRARIDEDCISEKDDCPAE